MDLTLEIYGGIAILLTAFIFNLILRQIRIKKLIGQKLPSYLEKKKSHIAAAVIYLLTLTIIETILVLGTLLDPKNEQGFETFRLDSPRKIGLLITFGSMFFIFHAFFLDLLYRRIIITEDKIIYKTLFHLKWAFLEEIKEQSLICPPVWKGPFVHILLRKGILRLWIVELAHKDRLYTLLNTRIINKNSTHSAYERLKETNYSRRKIHILPEIYINPTKEFVKQHSRTHKLIKNPQIMKLPIWIILTLCCIFMFLCQTDVTYNGVSGKIGLIEILVKNICLLLGVCMLCLLDYYKLDDKENNKGTAAIFLVFPSKHPYLYKYLATYGLMITVLLAIFMPETIHAVKALHTGPTIYTTTEFSAYKKYHSGKYMRGTRSYVLSFENNGQKEEITISQSIYASVNGHKITISYYPGTGIYEHITKAE